MSAPPGGGRVTRAYPLRPGDPVRIKDDTRGPFAGREDAWVLYPDGHGYVIRVGIATGLWFAEDELERRSGVLGL